MTPLQKLLADRGMSQGDLARGLVWDKGYISKIVNGKTTPGVDKALTIAAFLDVPVEDLFDAEHSSSAA